MSPIDWSLLIVRLVVGSTIVAHGVNHARSLESTARWFRRVGFRAARLQAALSAVVEMVAGVGLILGALTTIAAGAIIGVMTVAIGAIHRFNGFFIFRPGEGWEYTNLVAWTNLALAIAGPGRISLDEAIGLDLAGPGGALIAVAGFLLGLLQLAIFFHRERETV